MSSINWLKRDHQYKNFGTEEVHCANCVHFKHEEAYAGIEGMSADLCMLYRDNDESGVVILPADYGVCNAHDS